MTERTGSYPFMYIAQDFGVPYAAVLCYADGVKEGLDVTKRTDDPEQLSHLLRAGIWACRARDEIRALIRDNYDRTRFHAAVRTQVLGTL